MTSDRIISLPLKNCEGCWNEKFRDRLKPWFVFILLNSRCYLSLGLFLFPNNHHNTSEIYLCDFMWFGIDIDEHVSSLCQELLPYSPTLVGDVALGQLLHVPNGLHEKEVFGRVFFFLQKMNINYSEIVLPPWLPKVHKSDTDKSTKFLSLCILLGVLLDTARMNVHFGFPAEIWDALRYGDLPAFAHQMLTLFSHFSPTEKH